MLELENVDCYYDSVQVLSQVSLRLEAGEVLGLLGRNGAGKTTTLKAIMGLVKPRSGRVLLDDIDLATLPAHEVPKQGVAYVPQGRRLFPELTVEENLRMGLMVRGSARAVRDEVLDLFPALRERMRSHAGTLSGGQQQMLAMGRALCIEPKVLLLDEPSEGLMPSMVTTVLDTVLELKRRGVAILLVEQKVEAALRVTDRVVFMENGAVRHEASPDELAADPEPLQRYVGVKR